MKAGLALVITLATLGCGARTELSLGERCQDAGMRACLSGCGPGVQACVRGEWAACEPLERERACTNACGAGVEHCEDGAWTACDVVIAERDCEAVCGPGTQRCVEGAWTECDGPATAERACSDACGDGRQSCADGAWAACEVPIAERPCATPCGDGVQTCSEGRWGPCTARTPRPPSLRVVVRDFASTHPDFETDRLGSERGIVAPMLGGDGKPVYRGPSATTSGREAFDQWYRDVPGVNASVEIELPLRASSSDPSLFVFEDLTFFPIDGRLLGDERWEHNFHFTLEATGTFLYEGGETFRFRGDDDVWVFIDRRLAIDLGGVHGAEEATVSLDSLGLVPGGRYELHLFFAERHTDESTFLIETSVSDPILCD